MAEGVQSDLIQAAQIIHEAEVRHTSNGVRYAAFGDNNLEDRDLERMVQAVPIAIACAAVAGEATLVAPAYTPELGDQAICHRNVTHDGTEGVFISTRLL